MAFVGAQVARCLFGPVWPPAHRAAATSRRARCPADPVGWAGRSGNRSGNWNWACSPRHQTDGSTLASTALGLLGTGQTERLRVRTPAPVPDRSCWRCRPAPCGGASSALASAVPFTACSARTHRRRLRGRPCVYSKREGQRPLPPRASPAPTPLLELAWQAASEPHQIELQAAVSSISSPRRRHPDKSQVRQPPGLHHLRLRRSPGPANLACQTHAVVQQRDLDRVVRTPVAWRATPQLAYRCWTADRHLGPRPRLYRVRSAADPG